MLVSRGESVLVSAGHLIELSPVEEPEDRPEPAAHPNDGFFKAIFSQPGHAVLSRNLKPATGFCTVSPRRGSSAERRLQSSDRSFDIRPVPHSACAHGAGS